MVANIRKTPNLIEPAFRFLPIGSIKPLGWLKEQLQIAANGLTGHIHELWDELGPDNMWLGGEKEGWERGPYYVDGLLPLAYILNDSKLKREAHRWIDAFLSYQDEEGWIGPTLSERGQERDPWPIFVVLKVLTQYHEGTGDERVLNVMTKFFKYLYKNLKDSPLSSWAAFRWGDLMLSIYWLFERNEESWLLELASIVREQGYDWQKHFTKFIYTKKDLTYDSIRDTHMEAHGVNNAMGIKAPGIWFRQSHLELDREAVYSGLIKLDRYHGQVTGVFTADEHLSGKSPSQGTELCAIVEYMFSLEELVSIFGDPSFADLLERVAFNPLPAAFKYDMWAHQYDQQVNQVICSVAERMWSNGPEANIFGFKAHLCCCTANMHQGWPKFTSRLWMKTPERGLAAIAYAPSQVSASVGSEETVITITEETEYPFKERIRFIVHTPKDVVFPLSLRIPKWAKEPIVKLPEGEEYKVQPGTFYKVERKWSSGDIVELVIPMELKVERRYHGGIAIHRGPLVFSLKIEEDWKLIGGDLTHGDWEVYPKSLWNYGLKLDLDRPSQSIEIVINSLEGAPFSQGTAPIELKVKGRLVQLWGLEHNSAAPLPLSPVKSSEELKELTLIPYGCTNLRITEFPLLDD